MVAPTPACDDRHSATRRCIVSKPSKAVSLGVSFSVAVLVLGACGSSSGSKAGGSTKTTTPPAASGPTTTITAKDFAFTPTAIQLGAGGNTLKVTNSGSAKHNLPVEGLKVNKDLPPGSTQTVSVTAKAGTYQFHCEYPPTQM